MTFDWRCVGWIIVQHMDMLRGFAFKVFHVILHMDYHWWWHVWCNTNLIWSQKMFFRFLDVLWLDISIQTFGEKKVFLAYISVHVSGSHSNTRSSNVMGLSSQESHIHVDHFCLRNILQCSMFRYKLPAFPTFNLCEAFVENPLYKSYFFFEMWMFDI